MQQPASLPAINPNTLDIDIEDYVAHRFVKKRGKNKCRAKTLEAHANVKDLNLLEAKMNFIKVGNHDCEYIIGTLSFLNFNWYLNCYYYYLYFITVIIMSINIKIFNIT